VVGGAAAAGTAVGAPQHVQPQPAHTYQRQQAAAAAPFAPLRGAPGAPPKPAAAQQQLPQAHGCGADVGLQRDSRQPADGGDLVLEVPPPMNLEGVPPCVAATLQHIVAQLDALVTVVGGLDLRLREVEERTAAAAAAAQQGGVAVPQS
jgi:hypothetical protein